MPAALARHDAILRTRAESHDGHVFSTSGDGVAVAFSRAASALAAAVDAQRLLCSEPWPPGAEIRVRMGIHTGEALERDGDYFGPPLNRAARLMASGGGGQILVSAATAALVDPPPRGVELVALGGRRLRGLDEPIQVYGVRAEGLPAIDASAAYTSATPGNLPHPATAFVGHALDLKHLAAELPARRVVTLTGPGGVGKTRTAVEAAGLAATEFPEGTWFVELGPLAVPEAVTEAVATVVGARAQPNLSLEECVVDVLRDRRLLLVIDNCEHLTEAVSRLVGRILDACPTTTILATSREPLGLPGERVHVVRSLEPDLEGVELFCERARAADDSTVFGDDDRAVVAKICARLDGIPLAIELAAARSRSLGPAELLDRLDDRFRLLRGGMRGGAERHQTLRTAVAWSHQLLSEPQQILFERLSVFAGDFDLEAAEAICGGGGIEAPDVIDLLADLVDKSMLVAVRDGSRTRYRLLETLRSFGEERLADHGDSARLRDRHLAHYIKVAVRTGGDLWGPGQFDAAAVYDREWDNFRTAFDWALVAGDTLGAVKLLFATGWYATLFLRYEHVAWFALAVELLDPDDPNRPILLAWLAWSMGPQGDQEEVIATARSALELVRDPDQSPVMDWYVSSYAPASPWAAGSSQGWTSFLAHCALASAYLNSGRGNDALDAGRMAEALTGDDPGKTGMLAGLMVWVAAACEPALVAHYVDLTRRLIAAVDAPLQDAIVTFSEGMAELVAGSGRSALDRFRESLRLSGTAPSMVRLQALQGLTLAASTLDQADASSAFLQALTELYASRFWMYVWIVVETLGPYWVRVGRTDAGAVVMGHLEVHHHAHSLLGAARVSALAALEEVPGGAEAMARGARMDRDRLVGYVLEQLEAHPADITEDGGS